MTERSQEAEIAARESQPVPVALRGSRCPFVANRPRLRQILV
jgi:hypothetical protein